MKKRVFSFLLALLLLAFTAEGALASVKCVYCNGKGEVTCSNCGGSGRAFGSVTGSCGYCRGTGYTSCRYCGGTGRLGSDPGSGSSSTSSGGSGGGSATPSASISKTKLTLVAGRSETLKVDWASGKKVKWSSSDKKVATVSSKGKVKAKKAGKATITAKVGSQKLKCKVTVKKKVYAKSIKLKKTSATLLPSASTTLKYTISPKTSKITEKWSVSFSSSNKAVATVDKEGKVTARGAGKATITAKLKIKSGKYKKVKCKIKVESGLTRFKNWFNKHCTSVNGKKIYYSGDDDQIIYDASAKTWTFYRYQKNYNGYDEVSIRFNGDFTGNAYVSYYWYRSGAYTGVNETECTATQSTRSLSRNTAYAWDFTKGDERQVADASVASLLSGFQVLLVDDAKLNAKGGWRDLGLKAY